METGLVIAVLGATLAIVGGGIGTIVGTLYVAGGGAGLVAKNPASFGSVLLTAAIPSSQGIYGFLTAILIIQRLGLLDGNLATITTEQGWTLLMAALPVAVLGLVSGVAQGRVLQSGLRIIASSAANVGRAIILGVLIESMAVFGLLVSILIVNSI
ncbi:permease [Candidatus Dojkabacteria bacterium]|uniref:Permease n=1 Tax=Candidatus Dojkabacteria bacterium TaxID=2099670 RepID=A0A955I5H9_9BACT|nr:permease [Candidatus Dojkabacteria bacterium]